MPRPEHGHASSGSCVAPRRHVAKASDRARLWWLQVRAIVGSFEQMANEELNEVGAPLYATPFLVVAALWIVLSCYSGDSRFSTGSDTGISQFVSALVFI
eukprot:4654340-Pleurochrysis_carterae.AAC.3